MKRLVLVSLLALAGCAGEVSPTSPLALIPGQWTSPVPVGEGRYLVQGYSTLVAVKGGTAYCTKQGQTFVADHIETSTEYSRASITFHCK